MPFESEKQRRYMWANEPKIAEAWAHGKSSKTGGKEYRGKNKGLPEYGESKGMKTGGSVVSKKDKKKYRIKLSP
jgi:hypothetical protein